MCNLLSAAHMANRPFLTSLTLYVSRVFSLPLLKPACRSHVSS